MLKRMEHQTRERDMERALANATDAAGLWFAAAVVCAFLAAGIMVYRAGSLDDLTPTTNVATAAVPGH